MWCLLLLVSWGASVLLELSAIPGSVGVWANTTRPPEVLAVQGSCPSTSESWRDVCQKESLWETHHKQTARWSWRNSSRNKFCINLELETFSPTSTPSKIRYCLSLEEVEERWKQVSVPLVFSFKRAWRKHPTVITPQSDKGKETWVCSCQDKFPSLIPGGVSSFGI